MAIKVREAIRAIEADGWFFVGQVGSHRQYKHATKKGKVTIAGKPSDTLRAATWASVRKQAGI
jgi:predicted RNA binding protein YcfA (HicA-like mRNA interferase family)